MNIALRFSILLLFGFHIHAHEAFSLNIRVLLQKQMHTQTQPLTIKSAHGLMLTTSSNPKKKYFFQEKLCISVKNKKVCINNKKSDDAIFRITPIDGLITVNNTTYAGNIYIHTQQYGLDIINKLPLEDYIDAVLRTEGWPGWPLETYKVFAITCRSYVIYQRKQAQKKHLHYDIGSTNAHQTYCGTHSCKTIKDAVNETNGIIIAYNKNPILAMFDSCCGGIIPAETQDLINFSEAPYLSRSYRCTHCTHLKIYSWKKNFSLNTFKQTIQAIHPKIAHIEGINTKHDKAGITQEVIIKDKTRSYTIEGKKIYSLFPEVKSFAFTVTKKRNMVTISGTGYGHHIGLCQWGANELVKQGWLHKQIIHFYYPGTTLMRLKKKDV
jgi:stage II sporulation protein D